MDRRAGARASWRCCRTARKPLGDAQRLSPGHTSMSERVAERSQGLPMLAMLRGRLQAGEFPHALGQSGVRRTFR